MAVHHAREPTKIFIRVFGRTMIFSREICYKVTSVDVSKKTVYTGRSDSISVDGTIIEVVDLDTKKVIYERDYYGKQENRKDS